MAIQTKVFERVLSMAQMHQIGVLHRGPNMTWTCRWNEGGRQSSMCYELVRDNFEQSLKMRFQYKALADAQHPESVLDYTVSLRTSRSYKGKTWYWFICPLIINGKVCKRRVRNLYFLPNSEYFGCKHCRDAMVRSLLPNQQMTFRQTDIVSPEARGDSSKDFVPELKAGWRPVVARDLCKKCGCLSEGKYCCNCGADLDGAPESNFFEILGVSHDASSRDVRVAFMTQLKAYHPDRVAHLGEKLQQVAESEVKHINLAYDVLKDPGRRQAYLLKIKSIS